MTREHIISGYTPNGGWESLVELSGGLADCAKHGADGGFSGFIYHRETAAFFLHNRKDIIKMVQNFGVFRYSTPPATGEIGKALWDTGKIRDNLTYLYNVFAWFCLEEISHIWYRYLEDNPRPIASREPVSGYCQ